MRYFGDSYVVHVDSSLLNARRATERLAARPVASMASIKGRPSPSRTLREYSLLGTSANISPSVSSSTLPILLPKKSRWPVWPNRIRSNRAPTPLKPQRADAARLFFRFFDSQLIKRLNFLDGEFGQTSQTNGRISIVKIDPVLIEAIG